MYHDDDGYDILCSLAHHYSLLHVVNKSHKNSAAFVVHYLQPHLGTIIHIEEYGRMARQTTGNDYHGRVTVCAMTKLRILCGGKSTATVLGTPYEGVLDRPLKKYYFTIIIQNKRTPHQTVRVLVDVANMSH